MGKKAMAAIHARMSKYKKGSKEYKAAMAKMKMLKFKLRHAKKKKVVKKIVKKVVKKKGGKRAKKDARKQKAKAKVMAAKLAAAKKAMAAIHARMSKYKKGSKEYKTAMAKMRV